ncbi:MAG: hypothetical protein P1V51_11640 [Deltaproteobacteria bacterium]|nr:hypothetical protein [Deltaproteobacteria bacterium]
MVRTSALLLFFSLLQACGGPAWEDRPTKVVFEPASPDFWARPLPSDLRIQADGTTDLEDWPGDWTSDLIDTWLDAAEDRLDGWGVSSGVFVLLDGEIDPASLPAGPAESLAPGASVYLLDVDPDSPERGRRFPLEVEQLTQGDLYTPENLLAAIPVFGFVRRPRTTYALVITEGVRDAQGQSLGRSQAFHLAWEDQKGAHAAARDELVAVRETMEEEGAELDAVVGAAVFTTLDPNEQLLRIAEWAEALPQPVLSSPWTVAEEYESYQVLTAAFDVPVIQKGERPYDQAGEGAIDWGADGWPVIKETQTMRLVLSVPKSAQPAAGFPLTIILHGSGGEWRMGIDRGPKDETLPKSEQVEPPPGTGPAEWLARRGVATVGFDFPLHGDRHSPPDTSGLVFYNLFGNIIATLDNFDVAHAELLQLSRLMITTTVDPTLAPTLDAGAAPDGLIRFDPERLTALGQSMGTTLGVPWAAVDPRLKGALWSGAGGILVEIAVTALEPIELKPFVELLLGMTAEGAELHRAHPILHAFQNVWDLADPIAKAPWHTAVTHPGIPPKDVMMTAGVRDGYFHPRAETAMAVSLGIPLVGEEVEPWLPDSLRLAGDSTRGYPLQGNLNGRTAGVVHYASPENNGHYVIFNQDGARQQYTCFLASVGTPGGAKIAEARGLDDPCE